MKVLIQRVHPDAIVPQYQTDGASGFDLHSTSEVYIEPGEAKLVHTGLKVAIPEGYELQIRPRSGMALKQGITVLNSPGTVDSDYRGLVGVILVNHGKEAVSITMGQRIAQGVVCPVVKVNFEEVSYGDELPQTLRGEGGFGSTKS